MTVSALTNRAGPYTGNDLTTNFAYAGNIFEDSDLEVWQETIATGVQAQLSLGGGDYTVTGAGGDSGGDVVFSPALASTFQIVILTVLPLTQETDLKNQGAWLPEVQEDQFDRDTMNMQRLQEQIDRSVKVDETSSTDPADLISDLEDDAAQAAVDAAAAAASAAAALVSENNAEASENTLSSQKFEETVSGSPKQVFNIGFSIDAATKNASVFVSGVRQAASTWDPSDVGGTPVGSGATRYVKLGATAAVGSIVEVVSQDTDSLGSVIDAGEAGGSILKMDAYTSARATPADGEMWFEFVATVMTLNYRWGGTTYSETLT